MHLLFFSEKRSGSAAFRSVGNRGSPAPENAQANSLCYKVTTSVLIREFWENRPDCITDSTNL